MLTLSGQLQSKVVPFLQCPRGAWDKLIISTKVTSSDLFSLFVSENSSIWLLANDITLSYNVG